MPTASLLAPTMSILMTLKPCLDILKADGLFISASLLSEKQLQIDSVTYVTDVDEGMDVDCLCVHEDDMGLGGSCVCESFTTGVWLSPEQERPRGCVECPMCNRLAKPWALRKRCYSAIFLINETYITLLDAHPMKQHIPMPPEMVGKITAVCYGSRLSSD